MVRDLSDSPTSLELLARRFPDRANDLARLVVGSEHLQSLCEDYELAVNALRGLEARNRPQDAQRVAEYRRLIADLERELEACLGGSAE